MYASRNQEAEDVEQKDRMPYGDWLTASPVKQQRRNKEFGDTGHIIKGMWVRRRTASFLKIARRLVITPGKMG